MNEEKQGKSIFNLQRFMILQTKMNPQISHKIPDAYAYAWDVELYPYSHSMGPHEDLESYFRIKENKVDIIITYLDDEWLKGKLYTFYQVENYFQNNYTEHNINRSDLISVMRYVYLNKGFDKNFWDKMLTPQQHPAEASIIRTEFNSDDLYFV